MKINIRKEKREDISSVYGLIGKSFKNTNTMVLVEMLRRRKEFITELSLVAEVNDSVIGYILLSPVQIGTTQSLIDTLWIEPVCVNVDFRKKGIGSALIYEAISIGKRLNFDSVFVTGKLDYYSRFGFKEANHFGITSSIPIPSNAFLAMELKKNGLGVQGTLLYPQDIFD